MAKGEEEGKPFSIRLSEEQKAHCLGRGRSVNAYIKYLVDLDRARVVGDVYEVDLPPSVAKWYVALGGTLTKGIVEGHGMLTETERREWGEGGRLSGGDSARTASLEKLAEREAGAIANPWLTPPPRDPVAFAEEYEITFPQRTETPAEQVVRRQKYGDNVPGMPPYSGVGTERHGRPLPPIYQGGEDVTPRFKGKAVQDIIFQIPKEKGRKTGSVQSRDSQVTEVEDVDLPQEDFEP